MRNDRKVAASVARRTNMDSRPDSRTSLGWQSKLVLLLVLPALTADIIVETERWALHRPEIAAWTLGLSLILALITWRLHAATLSAAATGAILTASLMYSTLHTPYLPWRTALVPVLAVSLLAFAATRVGRETKERMGAAECREGRSAAQVASNLGIAALASSVFAQLLCAGHGDLPHSPVAAAPLLAACLAALAEAAADTVASETGQVFGGVPRMITTLRRTQPGADGAVSAAGTLAGATAAGIVAILGMWALGGGRGLLGAGWAGALFGLFFDSLLGATAELRGWLNNDAVNFLSTAAAAGFAFVVCLFPR